MNDDKLIIEAKKAMERAYAPYSKFKVGAACLLKNGEVMHGCNVENASYSLTSCAERNLLFSIISSGYNTKDIETFVIIANTKDPISPCGACRQVMHELLDNNVKVILANLNNDCKIIKMEDLLPYAFKEIENV